MTLSGTLKDGVHRLDIRVYYEDTDHSGRVYHANYLKFCERGRSETLKCAGIFHTDLAAGDLFFERFDAGRLAACFGKHGTDKIVVKPVVGANANNIFVLNHPLPDDVVGQLAQGLDDELMAAALDHVAEQRDAPGKRPTNGHRRDRMNRRCRDIGRSWITTRSGSREGGKT